MSGPTADKRQPALTGKVLIAGFAIVMIVAAAVLVGPAILFGIALWQLQLP